MLIFLTYQFTIHSLPLPSLSLTSHLQLPKACQQILPPQFNPLTVTFLIHHLTFPISFALQPEPQKSLTSSLSRATTQNQHYCEGAWRQSPCRLAVHRFLGNFPVYSPYENDPHTIWMPFFSISTNPLQEPNASAINPHLV